MSILRRPGMGPIEMPVEVTGGRNLPKVTYDAMELINQSIDLKI